MDQAPCVILEALKQLAVGDAATTAPAQSLESLATPVASRREQLLAKLGKKGRMVGGAAPREAPPVAATVPVAAPAAAAAASTTPSVTILLTTDEPVLEPNQLTCSLSSLRSLVKGRDYYSRDTTWALELLASAAASKPNVLLQCGGQVDLRELLRVDTAGDTVAFGLSSSQVGNDLELLGEVQLLVGHLVDA